MCRLTVFCARPIPALNSQRREPWPDTVADQYVRTLQSLELYRVRLTLLLPASNVSQAHITIAGPESGPVAATWLMLIMHISLRNNYIVLGYNCYV